MEPDLDFLLEEALLDRIIRTSITIAKIATLNSVRFFIGVGVEIPENDRG